MNTKNKKVITSYVRRGILLGLFFPMLAIAICIFYLIPEDFSVSLSSLHQSYPLLWIIDTAPFVLGLVSYIVGIQVSKSNKGFSSEIQEINEALTQTNVQLKTLNDEKEVLLKEIHHRVKNNLQVITSLLSLQASFIEDSASKALFRYSQYRINSMAIIHEMLYQSKDISRINYDEYTNKLVSGLLVSMKGSEHKINLEIDVPKINLNIDTAIPLGLLINEIVTNALKYGVPNNNVGTLYIQIKNVAEREFVMLIGDDGVGFSEDISFRNSQSLGLILMHKLSIQLKGNIEKDNSKKGTNYILTFKEIEQNS